jgi:hypothetical protein
MRSYGQSKWLACNPQSFGVGSDWWNACTLQTDAKNVNWLQAPEEVAMAKLDERTIANMDFVLEETCRVFPHGGDHERRRFIARKLKLIASKGNVTLGELRTVAHIALKELTKQKSA